MRVVWCISAAMRFCVHDTLYKCGTHVQKNSRSEQKKKHLKILNLQTPADQYGYKKQKKRRQKRLWAVDLLGNSKQWIDGAVQSIYCINLALLKWPINKNGCIFILSQNEIFQTLQYSESECATQQVFTNIFTNVTIKSSEQIVKSFSSVTFTQFI